MAPDRGPAPLEVQALVMGAGPGAVCSWSFGDGTRDSGRLVTHTYCSPGLYTITFKSGPVVRWGQAVVEEPSGE